MLSNSFSILDFILDKTLDISVHLHTDFVNDINALCYVLIFVKVVFLTKVVNYNPISGKTSKLEMHIYKPCHEKKIENSYGKKSYGHLTDV